MNVDDSLPLSLINSPKFSPHSEGESLKIPLLLAVQMPRQFHFLPMSLNVRHFVRLLGTTRNEGSHGYESTAI